MTLIPPPSAESLKRARTQQRRHRRRVLIGTGAALCAVAGVATVGATALTSSRQAAISDSPLLSMAPERAGDLMPHTNIETTAKAAHASKRATPTPSASASAKPSAAPDSASPEPSPTLPPDTFDICPSGDFSPTRMDGRCTAVTSTVGPAPRMSQIPALGTCADQPGGCADTAPAAPPRPAPAKKVDIRLMQATSAAPGQYYCAMWWDGVGSGKITSNGQSYSESGKQTGVGGTFHGTPGTLATCTFSMNGETVGTRSVAIVTQ